MRANYFIVLFLFFLNLTTAQYSIESFLTPADTVNKKRLNAVFVSEVTIGSVALIGLNQLWYSDYPRSNFHFINDNSEWLQMDKMGHVFSSYQLGSMGANTLKWAGLSRKNQLLYGATVGLAFMTTVEVFDGYSANWGASMGDVVANVSGTALYVSQELLWKEQRIIPKFSFHTTPYAARRPNVLGSTLQEQLLKDYNGQTYWLSANIYSFTKLAVIPKWLNIAVGYGAEGMITGNDEFVSTIFLPESNRYRQFYLSMDIDLTKFQTKSHFVKTILTLFNTIKFPAPAFEIKGNGGSKMHLIYF